MISERRPRPLASEYFLWLTGLLKNPYSHPLSEPNDFFYFQLKGYRAYRKYPFAYLKACKVATGPTGISCNRRKKATIHRTIIISFEKIFHLASLFSLETTGFRGKKSRTEPNNPPRKPMSNGMAFNNNSTNAVAGNGQISRQPILGLHQTRLAQYRLIIQMQQDLHDIHRLQRSTWLHP